MPVLQHLLFLCISQKVYGACEEIRGQTVPRDKSLFKNYVPPANKPASKRTENH